MGFTDWIKNVLFPRRCVGCDTVLPYGEYICSECLSRLTPLTGLTCRKCGKELKNEGEIFCYDCSRKLHNYDRGFALFEYKTVRDSIYRFKYMGRAEYADYFGMVAAEKLKKEFEGIKIDALIPVPIHKSRLKKRGYNQATELAKVISRHTGIPVADDICIRQKSTIPLKLLREEERINNLKKALIIARNDVKLKTIIIIDDIYTTGSTIDAMSELFRAKGVGQIYFISVAIGKGL